MIRVRAPEADDDGSVSIDAGVGLALQARDMSLATACAEKILAQHIEPVSQPGIENA